MKYILFILVIFSLDSFGQVDTVVYNTMYPNGMFGQKRTDTIYTLPRTTLKYFTGYGTFGSFYDTARAALSVTGTGLTYDNTTGVFTSSGSGWSLTGNTGLNSGSNFIGHIDNKSFRFRINNVTAGRIDSVPSYNTSLGVLSLQDAAVGIRNTAFGAQALQQLTSGTENVAIGVQALYANLTGIGNIGIGYLAGATTTGYPNIFIGKNSGNGGTAANGNNVGIGNTSLANLSSGAQNYMIGDLAGRFITTGSYNVGMGYNTMGNSSGTGQTLNTGIGARALEANTGNNNAALGYHSLNLNTSGGANIALGYFSGKYNTTRSSQLYINSLDRATDFAEQNLSMVYGQQSTSMFTQYFSHNGKVGINNNLPTAFLHLSRGRTVASSAPLKFSPSISLTTTATAGSGGTATLTFATQTTAPFFVGESITVAGVTPAGYNGTYTVTAVTATTVQYANATTGAQTVAGTIIPEGILLTTPESGAMESNGMRTTFTGSDGVRGIQGLTFTGTAAPATTPSSIGDFFVDTTNDKLYIATGTASSADWIILN